MNTAAYAVVFPGQGSQSISMMHDLAEKYPQIKETFQQVSSAIDIDLWQIVEHGPKEEIDSTVNTQPIMLAADVALWRVWQQQAPDLAAVNFLAGHSLGEYSALVCAESLSLEAASMLVKTRAQLMQQATAPGEGSMAAILGLDDATVKTLCEQNAGDQVLSPANYNCIGQCVVAGNTDAVDRLIIAAKEAGAKIAKKIPVSVPSHCALMSPASESFKQALAEVEFSPPKIPVIHNVDVSTHSTADGIRLALLEQLTKPVRWVETIQYLAANNVNQIIECGPGQVLVKLNRRIEKAMGVFSLHSVDSIQVAIANFQQTAEL